MFLLIAGATHEVNNDARKRNSNVVLFGILGNYKFVTSKVELLAKH